jgi:SAM-dependent methyltransferase
METVQTSRAVRVFDRSEPYNASSTSQSFRQHVEPLIERLEGADWSRSAAPHVLTMRRYARTWRDPLRQRELSSMLDDLLPVLGPGRRCLAIGLGLLPLAYVLAARSVWTDVCDHDGGEVRQFRHLRLDALWDGWVDYSTEDLGRLSYPEATFDAVAWMSAPGQSSPDQGSRTFDEMLRVLKPGGVVAVARHSETPGASHASRPGPVSTLLRFGLGKSDMRGNW